MQENGTTIIDIIKMAMVAGFSGSVIGGLIPLFIKKPSKKLIGLSFIFATTVLIALVFIDFIPHAIGHGHYHVDIDPVTGNIFQYWYQHSGAGIWLTILGMAIGVGLVVVLSLFDKHGHEHLHGVFDHSQDCSHEEDSKHALTNTEKKRMIRAAIPVAFAIILHDLPKGLAIGSAGSLSIALIIGMSCVPEGMSIAIPLKAGGMKATRILGICAAAGLATVIGAVIGYLLGGINVYLSGIMFAVGAGCILATVFTEMLPLAIEYTEKSKLKFIVVFIGVALVMLLNYFFHGYTH